MHEIDPCEVCNNEKAISYSVAFDGLHQKCPRCGEFKLSGSAATQLRQSLGDKKRSKLSGWIHQQNSLGSVPTITFETIVKILERSNPAVSERIILMLKEAESGLNSLSDTFNINDVRFLSATYSENQGDVGYLASALEQDGLIKFQGAGGICLITAKGYLKLEENKSKQPASSQGFIAMWFDSKLNEAYTNGLQLAVLNAGYNPLRIDKVEHLNRIDDEIVMQIKASKFVVADFTGHRGGVYFEAGFALGLNIPVFWTCHKDDMKNLHFDIRQFNCIDWETPDELANRLAVRIEAVLGMGPFLNP